MKLSAPGATCHDKRKRVFGSQWILSATIDRPVSLSRIRHHEGTAQSALDQQTGCLLVLDCHDVFIIAYVGLGSVTHFQITSILEVLYVHIEVIFCLRIVGCLYSIVTTLHNHLCKHGSMMKTKDRFLCTSLFAYRSACLVGCLYCIVTGLHYQMCNLAV